VFSGYPIVHKKNKDGKVGFRKRLLKKVMKNVLCTVSFRVYERQKTYKNYVFLNGNKCYFLVWTVENKTKMLVWLEIFCSVPVEMKMDTSKNTLVYQGKQLFFQNFDFSQDGATHIKQTKKYLGVHKNDF